MERMDQHRPALPARGADWTPEWRPEADERTGGPALGPRP
jgi:hypothetical protein